MRGGSQIVAEAKGLERRYAGRSVLAGLDMRIHQGEIVVLLGQSGCGKTTLLRTLAGLDAPQGGSLSVSERISVVFQEPRLLPWKRVLQNVMFKSRSDDTRIRALEILTEVGLANHARAWPATLSGGEAQRASLARALLTEPELLLLDEPFAALDALTRLKMHVLIRELIRHYSPGTLLVTHDVEEAVTLADRVLVMRNGTIAVELPISTLEKDRESGAASRIRRTLLAELGVSDLKASLAADEAN